MAAGDAHGIEKLYACESATSNEHVKERRLRICEKGSARGMKEHRNGGHPRIQGWNLARRVATGARTDGRAAIAVHRSRRDGWDIGDRQMRGRRGCQDTVDSPRDPLAFPLRGDTAEAVMTQIDVVDSQPLRSRQRRTGDPRPDVFCALLLHQHDPATERGELTIRAAEVRLYPRCLCSPDASECAATTAR